MSPPSSPFPNTQWTLLQKIRRGTDAEAQAALEALCKAYWFPIYAVARFKQMSEHDAQDAVQGYFALLLRRGTFKTAVQGHGRLRNLLLKGFENYCINEWRKDHALKRGHGAEHVEFIDGETAEQRYLAEAHLSTTSVETLYNREWARSVMRRALDSLRRQYCERGRSERFELFVRPMMQEDDVESQERLAEAAGMTHEAFRAALHRLRGRYAEEIERELAATLDTCDPAVIQEEKLELFRAFN